MNNKIFNSVNQKSLRKQLRNSSTEPERLLWRKLRSNQILGCKFRRQQGVEKYIADFYCPALHLAIELDGDSHYTTGATEKDRERDAYFESLGVYTLRFTNVEVMNNLNGVIYSLIDCITTLDPSLKRREG